MLVLNFLIQNLPGEKIKPKREQVRVHRLKHSIPCGQTMDTASNGLAWLPLARLDRAQLRV